MTEGIAELRARIEVLERHTRELTSVAQKLAEQQLSMLDALEKLRAALAGKPGGND